MQSADLTRLSTFVAVAERGSFARAAGALGRTTSTVSHAIKSLEDGLQLRLLNRTTRSVTLTEAGERLLTRVRPILADLGDALGSLDEFRDEPRGRLRLSVSSLGLEMVVARILPGFAQAYPDVALEAVVDNETGELREGREDAGVRGMSLIPQDMITLRVSPPGRQVAVASPEYLRRCGTPQTPSELAAHSCIQLRLGSGAAYRWEFLDQGRRVEVAVAGALATDSMDIVLRAALDGVGVAYTNEAHARPHLDAGRLRIVLEPYAMPFDGWHLYYPSRRNMTGPLRALAEYLRRPDVLDMIAGRSRARRPVAA
jgi:DNA-binding transcriptional LysR family regulator